MLTVFLVLLVGITTGTNCVCKCCLQNDCDPKTGTTQMFNLDAVCSAVTCNAVTCSGRFGPNTCHLPGTAGNTDSTCGATRLAGYSVFLTLSVALVGTVIKFSSY